MPGRSFVGANGYRYGFNGKEKDDETSGNGNCYDYGMRIYNPRLGKFLSVDPLSAKYAMLTPYQFASNTPIQAVDLDGLEAWVVIWASQSSDPKGGGATRIGHTGIVVQNYRTALKEVEKSRLVATTRGYEIEMYKDKEISYEPTGSYTYYDLWPFGATLAGKAALENVKPSYTSQEFVLQKNGILIKDNAELEKWLKSHDASQLDEMVKDGQSEVKESPPGSGVSGFQEGRPPDGIVRLDITPGESISLNEAYKDLKQANCDYNGVANNCTSYISNGLMEIGIDVKPEQIYDFYNIVLGQIVTEAQTPNNTYKTLKDASNTTIIKKADNATSESYEDAVLD